MLRCIRAKNILLVSRHIKIKSNVTVQREYLKQFKVSYRKKPQLNLIQHLAKKFYTTGSVHDNQSAVGAKRIARTRDVEHKARCLQ